MRVLNGASTLPVGSDLGLTDAKLTAVVRWDDDPSLFDDDERLALEYTDAMTITGRDVSDELFARLRARWNDDELVELTEAIAWEYAGPGSSAPSTPPLWPWTTPVCSASALQAGATDDNRPAGFRRACHH